MFARIGSRHFAHLYMSRFLRLRFRLRRGLRALPLERGRHDRPVRPAGEDVAASAARPDARRFPTDRDRGAPWTRVPPLQALLDFLDAAADSHPVAGAETADDACLSRDGPWRISGGLKERADVAADALGRLDNPLHLFVSKAST